MNLAPVWQSTLAVQIHLATIVPAFLLGTWLIFASRKGSPRHCLLGKVYLGLMVVTATAAIFIQEVRPGRFSWLHLFVLLTYWSAGSTLWHVRHKNIAGHRGSMLGLYIGGILIAGALTFAPGRVMYRMFFLTELVAHGDAQVGLR